MAESHLVESPPTPNAPTPLLGWIVLSRVHDGGVTRQHGYPVLVRHGGHVQVVSFGRA